MYVRFYDLHTANTVQNPATCHLVLPEDTAGTTACGHIVASVMAMKGSMHLIMGNRRSHHP